jgi:hypothetical protein
MRWLIVLTIATAWSFPSRAQPSGNLEELQRLVAEQQYAPALQKITAALALKGPAAKAVDRYQLFMLKGECLLQTKATRLSLDAYAAAIKEAASDHDRSLAEAHETLLKESKGFAYTPRTSAAAAPPSPNMPKARPAPIDILNLESRKKAFAALLADELAAKDAKIKAAKASKALPPIAQLFVPLSKMEGLELASLNDSAGEPVKVKAVRAELIDASKKIVAEALRGMSKRLGEIDKSANTFVEFYQESIDAFARPVMTKMYKKKGLTDPQIQELTQTSATCDKLAPALAELAKGLGAQDKTFEPFSDEAARIRKEVGRVLDTDYLRVYQQLPK